MPAASVYGSGLYGADLYGQGAPDPPAAGGAITPTVPPPPVGIRKGRGTRGGPGGE